MEGMRVMQISIEGVDGVINALQNLVSGGKIQNALAMAGEVVRADAVDNCPCNPDTLQPVIGLV